MYVAVKMGEKQLLLLNTSLNNPLRYHDSHTATLKEIVLVLMWHDGWKKQPWIHKELQKELINHVLFRSF